VRNKSSCGLTTINISYKFFIFFTGLLLSYKIIANYILGVLFRFSLNKIRKKSSLNVWPLRAIIFMIVYENNNILSKPTKCFHNRWDKI